MYDLPVYKRKGDLYIVKPNVRMDEYMNESLFAQHTNNDNNCTSYTASRQQE